MSNSFIGPCKVDLKVMVMKGTLHLPEMLSVLFEQYGFSKPPSIALVMWYELQTSLLMDK